MHLTLDGSFWFTWWRTQYVNWNGSLKLSGHWVVSEGTGRVLKIMILYTVLLSKNDLQAYHLGWLELLWILKFTSIYHFIINWGYCALFSRLLILLCTMCQGHLVSLIRVKVEWSLFCYRTFMSCWCISLRCTHFLITIRITIFLSWVVMHFVYHWQFCCALINSDYVLWQYLASIFWLWF